MVAPKASGPSAAENIDGILRLEKEEEASMDQAAAT